MHHQLSFLSISGHPLTFLNKQVLILFSLTSLLLLPTCIYMSISNFCSSFSCTNFTTSPSPTYLHVYHQLSFLSILYKQVLVLISLTLLLFQFLPTCMSASNLRIWASVDISFLYTRSWYCLFSCFCSSFSSLRSCFLHTHTCQRHIWQRVPGFQSPAHQSHGLQKPVSQAFLTS